MFKVGDKVVRKPEYQKFQEFQEYGWSFGDKIVTISSITNDKRFIRFVEVDLYWDTPFFTPSPPETKVYPKAGEYWKQRNGEIVGPLKVHERSGVLYSSKEVIGNDWWYCTGVTLLNSESSKDLVTRAGCCSTCGKAQ